MKDELAMAAAGTEWWKQSQPERRTLRTRAANGKGRVYRVGTRWYLRFHADNKLHFRTLKNEAGQPCTSKAAAKAAAEREIALYTTEEQRPALAEAARRQRARAEITERAQQIQRAGEAEKDIASKLPLVGDGWGRFLANREAAGKMPSPGTRRDYESIYGAFTAWTIARTPRVRHIVSVSDAIAREYAAHLNQRRDTGARLSPRSFNRHIGALRFIWSKLRAEEMAADNPWERVELRTLPKTVTRQGFTAEQAKTILTLAIERQDDLPQNGFTPAFNRRELPLFFGILYFTGMRMGDCARLQWPDIDLDNDRIGIVMGKTEHPLFIYLHPALKKWLQSIEGKREGDVFPTLHMLYERNADYICLIAKRIFEAAGIQTTEDGGTEQLRKKVVYGLHSFRHGLGLIATENGASLTAVSAALGHSTGEGAKITRRYAHLGAKAGAPAIEALPDITEGLDLPKTI